MSPCSSSLPLLLLPPPPSPPHPPPPSLLSSLPPSPPPLPSPVSPLFKQYQYCIVLFSDFSYTATCIRLPTPFHMSSFPLPQIHSRSKTLRLHKKLEYSGTPMDSQVIKCFLSRNFVGGGGGGAWSFGREAEEFGGSCPPLDRTLVATVQCIKLIVQEPCLFIWMCFLHSKECAYCIHIYTLVHLLTALASPIISQCKFC